MDVSESAETTQRHTYDLLAAFGDIGGLYEILYLSLSGLVYGFSDITIKSKLAKHLFSELQPSENDSDISVQSQIGEHP